MGTNLNFWSYLAQLDNSCRGNQNTHFKFNKSPPPENHTVYETTWKTLKNRAGHIEQYGT